MKQTTGATSKSSRQERDLQQARAILDKATIIGRPAWTPALLRIMVDLVIKQEARPSGRQA